MTLAAPALSLRDPRFIYRFDAGLSLSVALVFFAFASPLTAIIGWPFMETLLLYCVPFLVPWAMFNWSIGAAQRPDRLSLTLNLGGDALWVLLSALLLVVNSAQMSAFGVTLIIAQALTVSTVLAVKLGGLKALRN